MHSAQLFYKPNFKHPAVWVDKQVWFKGIDEDESGEKAVDYLHRAHAFGI